MLSDDILNFFNSKNCLVTGGTGMIGREIANMLINAGANVRVISLDSIKIHKKIDHVYGDLTSFDFCKEQTKDMDCIFHVAGIKGSVKVTIEKPASFFVPLLMFNTNVLEAARINNVQKLVYTSSIGAYSSNEIFIESDDEEKNPPMDMYPGWAKRIAEMQIKSYKIQYDLSDYSIVRPCNVYGPGDNFDPENAMVIPSLIRKAHDNEILEVWGDGSPIRDFIHCRDVALGMMHLVKNKVTDPVNLGSGSGIKIKEIAEIIAKRFDKKIKWLSDKPMGDYRRVFDTSRAEKHGFKANVSLEIGINETIDWFIENKELIDERYNVFK